MAAVLKHWREAATLILVTSSKTRLGSNRCTGKSIDIKSCDKSPLYSSKLCGSEHVDNFEVLLLKRSSKSKFMPNKYVFPGGVAINSDFSPEWINLFSQLGTDLQSRLFAHVSRGSQHASPMFTRSRDPSFSAIPPEVAFRICAIRETFEESGILLARPLKHISNFRGMLFATNRNLSSSLHFENEELIIDWRHRVNSDPDQFLVMCKELKLIPEIWSLYEWANWMTPAPGEEKKRRFDTVFYMCCIDHKPDAAEDKAETVHAQWISPTTVLKNYGRDTDLAFPQIYELARFFNFSTIAELLTFIAKREHLRVERWLGIPIKCKDCIMFPMPGDDLYPPSPDLVSKEFYKVYSETRDELNQMYPHSNRSWFTLENYLIHIVECNIPGARGHVSPRVDILDDIVQAKLKAKL